MQAAVDQAVAASQPETGEVTPPEAKPLHTLQVICDRCKRHVGSLETTRRTLKKGFLEIGITCPYCGFWGHAYYTTPKLEMDRKALDNFKGKARLSTFDRRKYEKKLVEFQRKYKKVQAQAGKLVRKAPAPS